MPDLSGFPEMNEESKPIRNQSELEDGSFTPTLSVICEILRIDTTPVVGATNVTDAAGLITFAWLIRQQVMSTILVTKGKKLEHTALIPS